MSHSRTAADVVYVIEKFPSDTLNFVYNEIRVLEAEGIRVEVHSLQPGGLCPADAAEFADRTLVLGPVSPGQFIQAIWHYLCRRPLTLWRLFATLPWDSEEGRLSKAVRLTHQILVGVRFAWKLRERPCHLHAHFAFKAATAALVAARLNGTTFSFTSHGSDTVVRNRRFALRTKVREALFVVAVSAYNRSVLAAYCSETDARKIVINHTGVLLDQFPLRTSEPPDDGVLHIVCIASLYAVKNHEGLLRACGALARRGIPFRLSLAGRDVDGRGERLRALAAAEGIAAQVDFLGIVDHDRVASLLETADICLLTSFSEGIPVALMEGMARGVPVIGPRVTGVAELVEDGVSGLLIDPHDTGTIVAAMVRLAGDRDLRARMTAAARQRVETEFDMNANARRLADFVRRRLSGPGSGGPGGGAGDR